MAYLNEFPNLRPNELNLNWLLKQYATFNDRIQEILNHFDETIVTINGDIDEFKREVNGAISDFEREINSTVSEYNAKVDSINENIGGYVNEYLVENINTILVDNPVLETKYTKFGYIDTNETCTLELEEDKLYEIMTIDYALNMHKGIAVNNAFNITQTPPVVETVVGSVVASEGSVPLSPPFPVIVEVGTIPADIICNNGSLITGTTSNNVLTITNNGTNRVRVYYKIIGEL